MSILQLETNRAKCAGCRKPLPTGELYFCRACFFELPGQERAAMVSMHLRKQSMDTKIAKCVRLLKAKQEKRAGV